MFKFIFIFEVIGFGLLGDVVDVKNGYVCNFFVLQGFVVLWSKGGEKQIEQIKVVCMVCELVMFEDVQLFKLKFELLFVKLVVKVGCEGCLFGLVKIDDIVEVVVKVGVGFIDKCMIEFVVFIKGIGIYEVMVCLCFDVVVVIIFEVVVVKQVVIFVIIFVVVFFLRDVVMGVCWKG